jgi:hypothetical protein
MGRDLLSGRRKMFENKFAHDNELNFKMLARRDYLLGVWAAEQLNIQGDAEKSAYAQKLLELSVSLKRREDAILPFLLQDFIKAGIECSEKDLRHEMGKLSATVSEEILGSSL